MSMQSQKKNMKTIHGLVSQNLGYIFGERESGPNGAKKQFHTKSAAFLRALGRDLGFQDFKVTVTRHFIVDEKSILFSTVSTPLRHLHFADRTLLSTKLCSQIKIFRLELCVQ